MFPLTVVRFDQLYSVWRKGGLWKDAVLVRYDGQGQPHTSTLSPHAIHRLDLEALSWSHWCQDTRHISYEAWWTAYHDAHHDAQTSAHIALCPTCRDLTHSTPDLARYISFSKHADVAQDFSASLAVSLEKDSSYTPHSSSQIAQGKPWRVQENAAPTDVPSSACALCGVMMEKSWAPFLRDEEGLQDRKIASCPPLKCCQKRTLLCGEGRAANFSSECHHQHRSQTLDEPFCHTNLFQDAHCTQNTGRASRADTGIFLMQPSPRHKWADLWCKAMDAKATMVCSEAWPSSLPAHPAWAHHVVLLVQLTCLHQGALALNALMIPSFPPEVVAITGSDGKTSTANFVHQLWGMLGVPHLLAGTLGMVRSDALTWTPSVAPQTFAHMHSPCRAHDGTALQFQRATCQTQTQHISLRLPAHSETSALCDADCIRASKMLSASPPHDPHPMNIRALPAHAGTTPTGEHLACLWRAPCAYSTVLEASSHSLHQKRLLGVPVDVGVMTSFHQDHLDYHNTMEEYWACKMRLFTDYGVRYGLVSSSLSVEQLERALALMCAKDLAWSREDIRLLHMHKHPQREEGHHRAECPPIVEKFSDIPPHVAGHVYGAFSTWENAVRRGEEWARFPQATYRILSQNSTFSLYGQRSSERDTVNSAERASALAGHMVEFSWFCGAFAASVLQNTVQGAGQAIGLDEANHRGEHHVMAPQAYAHYDNTAQWTQHLSVEDAANQHTTSLQETPLAVSSFEDDSVLDDEVCCVSDALCVYRWRGFVPLVGEFQIANLLAALCSAFYAWPTMWQEIPLVQRWSMLTQAIPLMRTVKGRMEWVGQHNGAHIFVDYAHTAVALENAIRALQSISPQGVNVVFGCGGNRQQDKRYAMGCVAHRLCAMVVVTDDNPRHEDPQVIRQAILQGCPGAVEIAQRKDAIFYALTHMSPGQTLLVAGKGHENMQIYGNEILPFNDGACIREWLALEKEKVFTHENTTHSCIE